MEALTLESDSTRDTLTPLAPQLWVRSEPLRFGLIRMNHRMTVIRRSSGELLVHSPVEYSRETHAALEQLGETSCFVAPSSYHDLYWKQWFEAFPSARFVAVPGMREQHSELPFTNGLDDLREWDDALEALPLEGIPRLNETAFLHRASRSLIVADLLFNFTGYEKRLDGATKLTLKLAGTYGRVGVSRLFRMFIKDSTAFRRSLDRILQCDFDRVVVGHGDVVETDGRSAFERAWSFLHG